VHTPAAVPLCLGGVQGAPHPTTPICITLRRTALSVVIATVAKEQGPSGQSFRVGAARPAPTWAGSPLN
jgi:hypothetical protein